MISEDYRFPCVCVCVCVCVFFFFFNCLTRISIFKLCNIPCPKVINSSASAVHAHPHVLVLTHTLTHTHARTLARTPAHFRYVKNSQISRRRVVYVFSRMHTQHTLSHTYTNTHTHTSKRTCARAHTHTHTHSQKVSLWMIDGYWYRVLCETV